MACRFACDREEKTTTTTTTLIQQQQREEAQRIEKNASKMNLSRKKTEI